MFSNWLLINVSLGYIGLLFLIAHLGGKYRHQLAERQHTIIYALSLGVYCTSWGFLGTSAQAANNSFTYLSVYLGPILLFIFAWPLIQRIIKTSLALKITSIADLLSARFGKARNLAVLVTIVALIGTLPYITLQLKAIIYSFTILQQEQNLSEWKLGLIISVILAIFTMIFGIRTINVTERHPGVMIAIAFESLIKLTAFLMVGLFVSFVVYDSPIEIINLAIEQQAISKQFEPGNFVAMVGLLIIVMSAFLCLPRQFQVMFVEIKDKKHSSWARWLLPAYILIFALFAAPIGLAGKLNYGESLQSAAYVLFLPAYDGEIWLSLFAFIGAISAASSMVIVSTIALSTMLSNEIAFPLLFKLTKQKQQYYDRFKAQLLLTRKLLVVVVIALSYAMLILSPADTLASLGEVAFGAIAQIGPSLLAAFFWRRATLVGVLTAISTGFSIWVLFNLMPQLGLYTHPLLNTNWPATTTITLIALAANITVLYSVSVSTRQSIREQMQSKYFNQSTDKPLWQFTKQPNIEIRELECLVARFIGDQKAKACFTSFIATTEADKPKDYNQALILHTEQTLASIMGAASAKLVTSFALGGRDIAFDQVADLVEKNSTQQLEFNRTVLQRAIENASEGISVIDSELTLVAWNDKYLDIFNFPKHLIYIGAPISELIRFNLTQQHNVLDIEHQVQKRLTYIKQGSRHSSERQLKNGKVIHIEGNPIPGGGFVMIFSDITVYRQTEAYLKEENDDLENRVEKRTSELEKANQELELANLELAQAQQRAEQAHLKKSQYLRACSHDLLQPLSAARLFSSALSLSPRVNAQEREQMDQINTSLEIANTLLQDLNEMARIESGNITPDIRVFSINELFDKLVAEFNAMAGEYKVKFRYHHSRLYIKSDLTLLSRVIQNFLSNAFRYSRQGQVVLGCRRRGDSVTIQVIDTGPGIPQSMQQKVFNQFTQLSGNQSTIGPKGLGLGLNIAQSLAKLLGHPLGLRSAQGHGSTFEITVPTAQKPVISAKLFPNQRISLKEVGVLCVDNEPQVLAAMTALLTGWQCNVFSASTPEQALTLFSQHKDQIDILLIDYELTDEIDDQTLVKPRDDKQEAVFNGIGLTQQLRSQRSYPLPAILITATNDEFVKINAKRHNIAFLAKIIKPLALRSLMSALLAQTLKDNYLSRER
ncbi:PAS-domain containing protein [Psychrobium sp. 1_MG-2023]|uniref:hybrid sensor histidine kinase/response regulator n=1 Tax=Psychrobium sp. 1_MG-2023 TaxID=3062624 RepID=UPI000C33BA67|nr:PAS-domain containing protein [Psychrobium sp. 1_MG-2023]MDP2560316.1 PAS-domain containing protein [Psychrobium sp. 1_MG-2023]PKF55430.1 hybrid sensor histidine kinase/response regulator [Alteromonadales bacterium alter-6D02]